MSTEREHAHDRKHDDDHRDHDDRSVGRVNRSAMLSAPEHPVTSGLVARKAARDDNGVEAGADQAIATAASSNGMSLPSPIMRKFEASLGADLSGVRVHTGAESQTAASAVGAKAYTMGQDIHFGAGQYDPSSGAGEHLLAHEVAHTVQQAGGTPTRQNKLEVSTPFDAAEHEADRAADAMVSRQPATVTGAAGVARQTLFRDANNAATTSSKDRFDLAVQQSGLKFSNIAQQQGLIVQQTKEAAVSQAAPPIEMTVLASVIGTAIGAVAGPLGAAIASRVASELVQKAIVAAVTKGGAYATTVASTSLKQVPNGSTAEAYFNCVQLTYSALAGHHSDEYLSGMQALWASVKDDPKAAADACSQAEAGRAGMQEGLDEATFATQTQNAAFSGWCSALFHSGRGGVLEIETTVADHGNAGGKVMERASIRGISDKLTGVMANRPLGSYHMPIEITASYFTSRPSVGAVDSEGGGDQLHTFVVNIDEVGHATAATPDPWLLARGGGDANAGAQSFYAELSSVTVPLTPA